MGSFAFQLIVLPNNGYKQTIYMEMGEMQLISFSVLVLLMVNAQAELLGFSGAENPKALWYMEIKGVREGKK